MNVTEIDRILAAVERAEKRGTIPKAKVSQEVAQALGISEDMVKEALERAEQAA